MDLGRQYIQKKIKLKRKCLFSSLQQKTLSSFNGVISPCKNSDYFIPLMLTRTSEIYEYADIKKDKKIIKVERQNVNPYFSELGFFDNLSRIKVNYGSDLTLKMIEYISQNISNVKILATYSLDMIQVLTYPETNIYYGYTGIMIKNRFDPTYRPVSSKLLLDGGTPYDGVFNIQWDWIDSNGNVGGFFCSPLVELTTGAINQDPWLIYKNPNAKVKLIDILFNKNDNEEIREWFNRVGYNQMINEIDPNTGKSILYSLETVETLWNNLISKAAFYKIAINS